MMKVFQNICRFLSAPRRGSAGKNGSAKKICSLACLSLVALCSPSRALQISEVYFDGSDERIELHNDSSTTFSGEIVLSGVRTSANVLTQHVVIGADDVLVLADDLATFVDTSKTVLGNNKFSISDTAPLHAQLLLSGAVLDDFVADAALVSSVNNLSTSLERLSGLVVPVSTGRVANVMTGFFANPGLLFFSGSTTSTGQQSTGGIIGSGTTGSGSVLCFTGAGGFISEVRLKTGGQSVFIEIINKQLFNYLIISGSALSGSMQIDTSGWNLNEHYLIAGGTGGLLHDENILLGNFDIVQTGLIQLFDDAGNVIDAIKIDQIGGQSGQSLHRGVQNACNFQFDAIGPSSPGFNEQFLQYLPIQYVSQTVYVTIPATGGNGNQNGGGGGISCPTSGGIVTQSGNHVTGSNVISGVDIQITLIDYNPPGSDTNNERLGLKLLSGASSLAVGSGRTLEYDGKTYNFGDHTPLALISQQEYIVTANFRFVNSRPVCVSLLYESTVYDTFCYDPAIHDSPRTIYDPLPVVTPPQNYPPEEDESGAGGSSVSMTGRDLQLGEIIYDPPGSDKDNELIEIISHEAQIVDMGPLRIRINGRNKKIDRTIAPGETLAIRKTRGLSNSKPTCVQLVYFDFIFDEKCYDPEQEDTVVTGVVIEQQPEELIALFTGKLKIEEIVYDPPGNDRGRESINFGLSGASFVDFSKDRHLLINQRKKSLNSFKIQTGKAIILTGTFNFPNTKDSCIKLFYQDKEKDQLCYEIPIKTTKIKSKTLKTKKKKISTSDLQLRVAKAYISELEDELKSNRYAIRKQSVLQDLSLVYRNALKLAKNGVTSVLIDEIRIKTEDIALQYTLQYNIPIDERILQKLSHFIGLNGVLSYVKKISQVIS